MRVLHIVFLGLVGTLAGALGARAQSCDTPAVLTAVTERIRTRGLSDAEYVARLSVQSPIFQDERHWDFGGVGSNKGTLAYWSRL